MDDLLDKQMNGLLEQRKYLYSSSYKAKNLDYIRKRSSKYREYNKQLEQKRNLDKQRA